MSTRITPLQEPRRATKRQRMAARDEAILEFGEPERPTRGGGGTNTDSTARKAAKVNADAVGTQAEVLEDHRKRLDNLETFAGRVSPLVEAAEAKKG